MRLVRCDVCSAEVETKHALTVTTSVGQRYTEAIEVCGRIACLRQASTLSAARAVTMQEELLKQRAE